jgi:hypothetical protein
MTGIEIAAKPEADIEVGVFQYCACERHGGQCRDAPGKLKLEVEERFCVRHAVSVPSAPGLTPR